MMMKSQERCSYKDCNAYMYVELKSPSLEYPKKYLCQKCFSTVIVHKNGIQQFFDADGKIFYPEYK
ncbi:MAG: hypothetical protein MJ147_08075 [Clostridia bacterium]|nr:hypothetical protein [Clostridia bacterium]